ncbi:uncharacterized protein [Venturia canescens]|uniref:uncharacterized protein n=1 Tax=Venturia canescens TaxID=32260 RepID=UPI001C9CCEE6|nr:uncharacterized protein LOC122407910 [Venturia canescens]XP_043270326.1 uncharacterized protein LOC122407910 [Venturia canescens]XP_043270327.1 uncharacterized protein LOC122407910 [Venturia canescens]
MIRNLGPPKFKFFHPNACHVCQAFGKNIKLKRCSVCKKIAYCSREHQTEDWPRHRDICRVFNKLEEEGIPQIIQRDLKNRPESWMKTRLNLVQLIPKLLGRTLTRCELEMCVYARSCEICHETDFLKLRDCAECPDASFCIEHPRDDAHAANCETFRFSFEAFAVTASLDFPDGVVQQNYAENMPENMEQATALLLPHCPMNEITLPTKIWAAFVSRSLTRPYTFFFSMQKLRQPKLHKIRIHVVGANSMEMTHTHLWQILFHHDQFLEALEMTFVGPDLTTGSKKMELCGECSKRERKIDVRTVGNLYANFANGRFFTKPDYVIGFNLGISAHHFDATWAPTVKVLSKLSCPFSITSYFANEARDNQGIIDSILGKKVKPLWTGKNPFASLQPARSADHDELFCYDNHYLTVYEKLS